MIHGFCVDHHVLLGLDPIFAKRGRWRRVYLDLPGMGRSAAGAGIDGSDAVAEAVAGFARRTFGSGSFAVLGSSFGGMIARHLVAEFGDQVLGLALLCPVVVAEHARRILPARTVVEANAAFLASLAPEDATAYGDMAVLQSPDNWERFREAVLPGWASFDKAAVERISESYSLSVEPEDRAPEFTGPTLIVLGRQDHVVGFHDQIALSGHYPHSTVAVLDHAGHNAHLDQPELTRALIDDWLSRVERSIEKSGREAGAQALDGADDADDTPILYTHFGR